MTIATRKLGDVLVHIYDFSPGAAIYLPAVVRYEVDTPCLVGMDESGEAFHQLCLQHGFKNWLNVAVVSDTCDDATQQTEPCLIEAFNNDCQKDGWLWKMMNYRN